MNPETDRVVQALLQAVKAALAIAIPVLGAALSNDDFRQALEAMTGNAILSGFLLDIVASALMGLIKLVGGPTYVVKEMPLSTDGTPAGRGVAAESPGFLAV